MGVAVVTLGLAGCSIDLSEWRPGGGGDEPSPSPSSVDAGPVLSEALDALSSAPAVALDGQVSASGQQGVSDTALTVTSSGTTYGTLQQSENEAELMQADGKLFVKGPEEYWLDQNVVNPDVSDYAGNWVRVTGQQLGVNPDKALTPEKLSGIIRDLGAKGGKATLENLDGTSAYRIDLKGGENNRVWVSEDDHRLLRVELEELAAKDAEGTGPRARLNVAQPEAADVQQVYTDAVAAAKDELGGAPDARMRVDWDGKLKLDCETGGKCTVTGKVKDASQGDTTGSVVVNMAATLKNDELGEKKCKDSATLKAGKSVELSCEANYDLEPSANPQEYQINGDALLSTTALTSKDQESLVSTLKKEQKAAEDGGQGDPSTSPSGN